MCPWWAAKICTLFCSEKIQTQKGSNVLLWEEKNAPVLPLFLMCQFSFWSLALAVTSVWIYLIKIKVCDHDQKRERWVVTNSIPTVSWEQGVPRLVCMSVCTPLGLCMTLTIRSFLFQHTRKRSQGCLVKNVSVVLGFPTSCSLPWVFLSLIFSLSSIFISQCREGGGGGGGKKRVQHVTITD